MALQINGPVTNKPPIVKPSQAVLKYPFEYTDTGSNTNPGVSYTDALKMALATGGTTPKPTPTNPVTAASAPVAATSGGNGGGGNGGGGDSTPYVDPNKAKKDAYNKMLKDLAKNNKSLLGTLDTNYNLSKDTINNNYDLTQGQTEQSAANDLRQAYINYMMSKRNIDADMARSGYTGGLSESNRARMYNSYGTNRNAISNTLAQNLAQINANRNAALNELLATYNSNKAKQQEKYLNKKMEIQKLLAALG